jgi:hypothetical protein
MMEFQAKRRRAALVVALCMMGVAPWAVSDEVSEKGPAILEKNKDAVVTVMLVLNQKMSMPGRGSQNNESQSEATGTVINADGLTLISLSTVDSSAIMDAMMAGAPGMSGMTMETDVISAKILLSDDTEVPAEVVLRDKDLDFAFVRPIEKPTSPFTFVDMTDTAEPGILDQVISLNRMGRVARRVHSASVERIDAVVRRPRTFFIPGKDPTNTNMGSPAFTLDGQPIGVFLIRVIKSTGGGSPFSGAQDNLTTVLVPGADILDAASQAPPFKE